MITSFEAAARDLSARRPYFVEKMTALEDRGIPTPGFSSTYYELVCRSVGLQPTRPADDFDCMVQPDYFYAAAEAYGARVTEPSMKRFMTSDGQLVEFCAAEALAYLDGTEIQFMLPIGNCLVGGVSYDVRLTDDAIAACTVVETNEGRLSFMHSIDSIIMWAMCRREAQKQDLEKAATLIAATNPYEGSYAQTRAQQVGWEQDPFAQLFLECAQQRATEIVAGLSQLATIHSLNPASMPQLAPAYAHAA